MPHTSTRSSCVKLPSAAWELPWEVIRSRILQEKMDHTFRAGRRGKGEEGKDETEFLQYVLEFMFSSH